jgi:hypothetical protein
MPTEQQSTLTVLGNPNPDMQAAFDARYDTLVAIVPGTTHVEIHRGSAPFQRIWWSWYGTVGSWHVIQAPSRLPLGQVRIALPAPPDPPATEIYLRKPYNPRYLSKWDGVTPMRLGTDKGNVGRYLGSWKASTNTPTLVNGVGSDKQYFVAEDAGAVNFGAGPIAFVKGDWVIYDAVGPPPGEWKKAVDDPRRTLADDEVVEITVSFTQD